MRRTRAEHRKRISAIKRNRRVEVGPYVTFYFESFDTMWLQVQEMLHIEKGGAEQLTDELAAYNPLIPKGRELVATFMIEIDDPLRRARVLAGLGGIEETALSSRSAAIENRRRGRRQDQDRTTAEGKASSRAIRALPLHGGADRRLPGARRAGDSGLLASGLQPYGRLGGGDAGGTCRGFRLSGARARF